MAGLTGNEKQEAGGAGGRFVIPNKSYHINRLIGTTSFEKARRVSKTKLQIDVTHAF